jgi:hypothetical protein
MGTGKTRLALVSFELSDFEDLIVVTRRIAFSSWIDEAQLCKLDFLIYENDYTPKNLKRLGPSKKRVLLVSAGDLKNIPNIPQGQMIVVDELYLFANPQSKRSKLLQQITIFCSARIGLSGTIMSANDNMTVFGQLKALNGHRVLARTATDFRSLYQAKLKTTWGRSYLNLPGSDEVIAEKLAPYVDLNFPESRPTTVQIVPVDKTPQQAAAITELKEFYEHREHTFNYAIQIVNAINGISNGWFIESTGDLSYHKTPKLERLLAFLDELVSAGERVVVWCAYHNDIARISSELKHKWLEFTARCSFDEKRWREGFSFIVLATEANGASVNYFKDVKYAIYYSIDWKAVNLQQSMTRHERKGSKHDGAHYYFLQTKGTNDAKIYNLVNTSAKIEKDLILELAYE